MLDAFTSLTGGGGFSGSSGVTDQSSTAAEGATGTKNIGGNPNAAFLYGGTNETVRTVSPWLVGGLVVVAVLALRKRK